MPSLSPRERLVVGVGAALALVIGGHLLVVEPILARSRAALTTVPAREAALERRRLLVAQGPRIAEELAAVDARLESDARRLLRGPTAPLAASELQKLVKDLLAAGSVEIRSERVLPASDQNGLQEVPIELTIMGTIRDTVSAVSRLERADRLLTVKDFRIRVMAVGQPRELLTTLTVAGYLRPGSIAAKPDARAAATSDEN